MANLRVFALTHLLAAGFGFAVAPRELLETEVAHHGFFGPSDTKRVLSAAVESLRAENKLLVYSYKGFAAVSVERDGFLFLNGRQDLIVPAAVSYYVNLSRLTLNDVTFDEAAKRAKRLRSEVVLGGDPAVAKEEKKAVVRYAELAAQHLAHARTHMKSYDSLETIMRLHVVPRWGRHRLDEITAQEVGKWLAGKSDEGMMPATVEKLRVMFGRSFELGRRWGLAGCTTNPTRGIQRPKFDNKRERFLSAEEAGRLLAAAGESLNPQLRPIVALLLLTGARVSELLQGQWKHVDLDRRAWLIPVSKTGKSRYVPLSQAAIDIIATLPRFDACEWLVPNPDTKAPFVTIKHSWQTARKAACLSDLRIHDLRHSAASFMINSGVDLFAVGKVLGHADYKSTMRYSHLANETLLSAVEAGASKLSAQWAT